MTRTLILDDEVSSTAKGTFKVTPAPPVNVWATPWADDVASYRGPTLSNRALAIPTHAQAEKLDTMMNGLYHPKDNPDGIINMGVAENGLMCDEYIEYFGSVLKNGLNPVDMGYGDRLSGSARLKSAIAGMFNDNFDPVEKVEPDQILTGTGCTTILDQLSWSILNPSDCILIAAPFYAGFDVNMVSRSASQVVPVEVSHDGDDAISPKSLEAFEAALQKAQAEGKNVKAVLLCNPQNPLGRTYPRDTMLAYAEFAEKHNLHLISDEIYALSVYDNPNLPNANEFTSFLNIDVEKELGKPFDNSRLHIVYSFSKDFGANGLRVGCLISQHNPFLLRAMLHTAFLMKISSPADVLLSALLNDKAMFNKMVTENRRRLSAAATYCREWFTKRALPVLDTNAGHFMLVDFRSVCDINSFDDEKKLWQRLFDAGVYTASGGGYHWSTPGFLRITFSINQDAFKIGLERIANVLRLQPVE